MNKKLTLILLTNLVMAGSMVTDSEEASAEQPLLEPQTSFSIGLSLTERLEQLKQQVNTFREHFSSLIRDASEVRKDLGILRDQHQLRNQIEDEARTEASQTDLMPHAPDASTQADDPNTFVWDGTGEVPKDVIKVRIADGVKRIGSKLL